MDYYADFLRSLNAIHLRSVLADREPYLIEMLNSTVARPAPIDAVPAVSTAAAAAPTSDRDQSRNEGVPRGSESRAGCAHAPDWLPGKADARARAATAATSFVPARKG